MDQLDGMALRRMIIAGSNELMKNKALIDSLNVFPVPDGDTGTNMSLTALVAARELEKLSSPNACGVAATASGGSLRGARGNSGVILSQLFRGFARGIENKSVIAADDVSRAFRQAVETAYKAVMKPKEGTILTVATAVADKAAEWAYETDDIAELLAEIIKHGNAVLEKTTNMLPELKHAGVVDAGGKGLMCLLEGAYNSLTDDGAVTLAEAAEAHPAQPMPVRLAAEEDAEYGYCTEFFINVPSVTDEIENGLKQYLQSIGDSIVVVADTEIIKVHVHSEHPGQILEHALTIGALSNLKIENMSMQHSALIDFDGQAGREAVEKGSTSQEPAELGFVAVAAGKGLAEYFEGLGVNVVIEGGQTMNPSTDDILAAIGQVNAKSVFVLPNNSNIILAAKQAAELSKDKKVYVLPTRTIPQGISAMVAYLPMDSVEDNLENMTGAISAVRTGLMTFAVRDTTINSIEINEGDILCMIEGDITLTHKDVREGAKRLLDAMLKDGGDIVGIYYGEGVSEADAEELRIYIEETYPDFDIECRNGAQPLYYYIFSVE